MSLQDVVWKTWHKQRMIEMDGKRESGKSVLSARLDDDDTHTVYNYPDTCLYIHTHTLLIVTKSISSIKTSNGYWTTGRDTTWHNNYCHRKWNWQLSFKFWMQLFVFHFELILLKKAQIYLFRLSKTTSQEGKLWIQTSCTLLNKLTLCHILLMVGAVV